MERIDTNLGRIDQSFKPGTLNFAPVSLKEKKLIQAYFIPPGIAYQF
ncbi:hypothetical protein GO755_33715 [Spirosoma sp. HMF4905]|uniref:Uncharacterized protein n=1 Tax=Spirosoma arboris TaxID=2682092 RepID=A0A7K1SMY3_9BACT|nr:hypothetical protein [Spirosoma arboris]MVM35033.1 hypothetical protein [Spirosoma arboris]